MELVMSPDYHQLNQSTYVNGQPIGSIELKLLVAKAEGHTITENRHEPVYRAHFVDGKVVNLPEGEAKVYHYYNGGFLLPCFDAYRTAIQYYLEKKA
jgi:hypothetical protein